MTANAVVVISRWRPVATCVFAAPQLADLIPIGGLIIRCATSASREARKGKWNCFSIGGRSVLLVLDSL